jgi:hypothetical protein
MAPEKVSYLDRGGAWEADSLSSVYAYLPSENNFCAGALNTTLPNGMTVVCNDDYGTSIGRGAFNLTAGQ